MKGGTLRGKNKKEKQEQAGKEGKDIQDIILQRPCGLRSLPLLEYPKTKETISRTIHSISARPQDVCGERAYVLKDRALGGVGGQ